MGPVLLFDMSIVVFVIGSASGELDGLFSFGKVPLEVIVQELPSVVAIKPEDRERKDCFDMTDLLQDTGFSLSPYGALFGPAGGNINKIDSVNVHTGGGITAMSNGIRFKKAGASFIPLVGFDGDLFSQKRSGFCGAAPPFCITDAKRLKDSIYRRRRDFEQSLGHIRRELPEELNIARQPDRQDDFEAL